MKMSFALPAVAVALIATAAAKAQRMGHSNTNAPELRQSITLADKATVRVTYTSITWANGTWSKALADVSKRQKVRERINAAAAESPLGTFEATVASMVGEKHIAKGSYKLAFGLDEQFQWELRLSGVQSVAVPLELAQGARDRRRLTLNLNAGRDDESAVLHISFGRMECELVVTPHLVQKTATKSGTTVNQQCPFMDEPVDSAVTVSHKGQLVGFCCKDCLDEWSQLSTEKRDEKVAKAVAKKPSETDKSAEVTVNAKCPIMGGTVDSDGETAPYEGEKIGFCCPGCKPKWEAWSKAKKAAFIEKAKKN